MTSESNRTRPLQLLVRWTARLLSVLAAGVVVLFFFGEPHGPILHVFTLKEKVQLSAFFLVVVGLLAAWRWEWQGAAVSLLALGVFNGVEYAASGHLAHGAFPYFAIPAALYLLSAWIGGLRQSASPDSPNSTGDPDHGPPSFVGQTAQNQVDLPASRV